MNSTPRNFDSDVLSIIEILLLAIKSSEKDEKMRRADEAYSFLYDLIRDVNRGQVIYDEERGV